MQGVFLQGLSEELKDKLVVRDETFSLDELISLAIRLDNHLRECRRERRKVSGVSSSPEPLRSNSELCAATLPVLKLTDEPM